MSNQVSSQVFISYLPAILPMIELAARKALTSAGNEGRNRVMQNISGTRTGRTYTIPKFQRTYVASAPGEYPAIRHGDLKGSIRAVVQGDTLYIGTDKDYGLPLEKKDPNRGGRPWLKPSLDQATPAMLKELMKRWF